MNTPTPQNTENRSKAERDIAERLACLPAAARWEVLKHFWRGRTEGSWSRLEEAYVHWAGSSGAQWVSQEKDRESANNTAAVSAETLLAFLRELISDRALNETTRQSIREIVAVIEGPELKLVFGGHFKAGKSSTLNAVIGRLLLPAGRLPETGALCAIRTGPEESAVVHRSGQAVAVECSTEMIRSVCSIIDRESGRARDLSEIDWIELTLQKVCIPKSVVWIDSPGITDDHAMDVCARRAAAEADVLVWLLWTKHPLAEPETVFLQRHLNESGAGSVVFLLNCFLAEDRRDTWQEYASRDVPRIWRKLEEVIGPLGFSEAAPLVMLPISARAIREVDQNEFGGPDLRELLGQFDSPCHPRVQKTRWHRASMALHQLAHDHERQLFDIQKQNSRLEAELRQAGKNARGAKVALSKVVRGHLLEFLSRWSQAAREAGNKFAGGLSVMNLWNNGGNHGPELAERISRSGSVLYLDLRRAIEKDLVALGFRLVTIVRIDAALQPLLSNSLENDVPKAELKAKAWAKFGGVAAGTFLAVHPVGLALLVGGSVVAVSRANKQVEQVRHSISAAIEKFILEIEQKIDQIVERVLTQFPHRVELEDRPTPDRCAENRLITAVAKLRLAADEARKVSGGFVV
jgi:hypothetical protein